MLEPPIYSWVSEAQMTTFAFNWHLECVCVCVCVVGDGTDNLVGLNPHPVESDAISGQTVSELIKL